jgi:hypothetical protein
MDEPERPADDRRREGGPAERRRLFEAERGLREDEQPPPEAPERDEPDEGGDR